uniref:Fibrinogen C-terminal domain-containing protein n=1 Tax=Syphacia muris TaxID=451379 RepID=A0A0N5AL10_9BILA
MRVYRNTDNKVDVNETDPCLAARIRVRKSLLGTRGQRQLFALVFLIALIFILSVLLFLIIPQLNDGNSSNAFNYEGYDFFKVPAEIITLQQSGIVAKNGSEIVVFDHATAVSNMSLPINSLNFVRDSKFGGEVSNASVRAKSERRFTETKKIISDRIDLNSSADLTIGSYFASSTTSSVINYLTVDGKNFIESETDAVPGVGLEVDLLINETKASVTTVYEPTSTIQLAAVHTTVSSLSSSEHETRMVSSTLPMLLLSPVTTFLPYSPSSGVAGDFLLVEDCEILYQRGNRISGIYDVKLPGIDRRKIFCNMENNGGWNVIQRRLNDKIEFSKRSWVEYEEGFGVLNDSFWIGLKLIYSLVKLGNGKPITLRIELRGDRCSGGSGCTGLKNGFWFGEWDFKISNSSTNYALWISQQKIGNLSLKLPDMFFHMNNGQQFTTVDRDNDKKDDINCAKFRGFGENFRGWWHNDCGYAALNGDYNDSSSYMKGLYWKVKDKNEFSYNVKPRTTEMKVRL